MLLLTLFQEDSMGNGATLGLLFLFMVLFLYAMYKRGGG